MTPRPDPTPPDGAPSFDELMADVMAAAGRFGHREHVHLTWLAVRRFGMRAAVSLVSDGIQRTAPYAGGPQKYHATVSRGWVEVVSYHAAGVLRVTVRMGVRHEFPGRAGGVGVAEVRLSEPHPGQRGRRDSRRDRRGVGLRTSPDLLRRRSRRRGRPETGREPRREATDGPRAGSNRPGGGPLHRPRGESDRRRRACLTASASTGGRGGLWPVTRARGAWGSRDRARPPSPLNP